MSEYLTEAASISGSGDPFRELGRFQDFCLRARFDGLVEADPVLPVRAWLDTWEKTLTDITTAARLYVEWLREVTKMFCERLGRPYTEG